MNTRTPTRLSALLLAGLFAACGGATDDAGTVDTAADGPAAAPATASAPEATTVAQASGALPQLLVYKAPTCGCCGGWIEHLEEHGYPVESRDVANPATIKVDVGLPMNLASCHTALVEGYVVEGHVPAEAIEKLLAERPDIAGIAVPGMPEGSPGMEGPNPVAYTVYAFDRAGNQTSFMEITPR